AIDSISIDGRFGTGRGWGIGMLSVLLPFRLVGFRYFKQNSLGIGVQKNLELDATLLILSRGKTAAGILLRSAADFTRIPFPVRIIAQVDKNTGNGRLTFG